MSGDAGRPASPYYGRTPHRTQAQSSLTGQTRHSTQDSRHVNTTNPPHRLARHRGRVLQGGQGPDDPETVLLLHALRQAAHLSVHQPPDRHLPRAEADVLHQGEGTGGGNVELFAYLPLIDDILMNYALRLLNIQISADTTNMLSSLLCPLFSNRTEHVRINNSNLLF